MPGGEAGAGGRGWRPRWPILLKTTGRAAEQSSAGSHPRPAWQAAGHKETHECRKSQTLQVCLASRARPAFGGPPLQSFPLALLIRRGVGAAPRSAERGSVASLLRVPGASPRVEGLRARVRRSPALSAWGLLPCSPPLWTYPLAWSY